MISDGLFKVKMGLVLSGGRTGTTLLHELLTSIYPERLILQEPHPSRSVHIMANAADRGIPLRKCALKLFLYTRRRWVRHGSLVEINPFLCGIAKMLKPEMGIDSVVHMVRNPFRWVSSMLLFRGYGWHSRVTPYIPFVYGKPSKAANKWAELSEPERLAWNWVQINADILQAGQAGISILSVRFEDFVIHGEVDFEMMVNMASHLGLDAERLIPGKLRNLEKVNPSPHSGPEPWQRWSSELIDRIWEIVSPLASNYAYSRRDVPRSQP